MLSGPGSTPWTDPSRITFSIAPDGTNWGASPSVLVSTLDARVGPDRWDDEVARALQTWAAVADVNFTPVADSGAPRASIGRAQGDARFGDIRVGGFNLGDDRVLVLTALPAPLGPPWGGDLQVNTAQPWEIGADYDLYSVLLHEFGHSLGLEHNPDSQTVMFEQYEGIRAGLELGDIEAVQAIYGPRQLDAFAATGQGLTFSTAIDLNSRLGPSQAVSLSGLDLASIGQTEFFRVTAPAGSGTRLAVTAAVEGVSLMSPSVRVYDVSGRDLGAAADPTSWGRNAAVTVGGIESGRSYYVAVTGATSDVFAVGAYRLDLAFPDATPAAAPPATPPTPNPTPPAPPVGVTPTPPVVTPKPTPTPTNPQQPPVVVPPVQPVAPLLPDRLEVPGRPNRVESIGAVASSVTIAGLTLDTAVDRDQFVFAGQRPGVYRIAAPGTSIVVTDPRGRILARGTDSVRVPAGRLDQRFVVRIRSVNFAPVAAYDLTIEAPAPINATASRSNSTVGLLLNNPRRPANVRRFPAGPLGFRLIR